ADDADPGLLPEQLAVVRDELRRRAAVLTKAADEATLLVGGDDAAWRELLAAAEHGAELEAVRQRAQRAEGPAALAGLLSDPGWTRRWEPPSERLRALRDGAAGDPPGEAPRDQGAAAPPPAAPPAEGSPPGRPPLLLGPRR